MLQNLIKIIGSGALAALGIGLLIWLLSVVGVMSLLGLPVDASGVGFSWFLERTLRGLIYGLLFLLPVLSTSPQPMRGLVFGLLPALELMVLQHTIREGRGLLGTGTSYWLPVISLSIWVLWGWITGWLVERFGIESEE